MKPAPRRWVTDDFGAIRYYRRCTGPCQRWLEQGQENFTPCERTPFGSVIRWRARCRACSAVKRREAYRRNPGPTLAYTRRRWQRVKTDPKLLERRRASRRASERRARRDPARLARRKASQRAYYLRLYADAERHAAFLDARRIWQRARAIQAGRMPKPMPHAAGAYRPVHPRRDATIDVTPLREAIERALAIDRRERAADGTEPREGNGAAALASLAGVSPRMLYRYRSGEAERISIALADRLAIALGSSLPEIAP